MTRLQDGGLPAPSPKQNLAVLGTGLFVAEVVDLADDTGKFEVTTFIENWDRKKTRTQLLGRPVVWIDEATSLVPSHKVVCGLGTTQRRGFIDQAAQMGFTFAQIIHPSACLSSQSTVQEGSIISVGVIIAAYARIGSHVLINRGALIGHHTTVRDCVTISPGANIAGSVTIGEGTYIGMGAIVLDHLTIGAHSIVGAGAVVTADVPDHVQVTGIPARITKRNVNGR